MTDARRIAAAVSAVAALTALAAPPAGARVHVSVRPELQPAYSTGISDFVTRCRNGQPLRLKVHADGGDRVSIASRAAHGGRFATQVSRSTGHAFTIRVEHRGRRTRTQHVRCLPRDFPDWYFERDGKPQARWYVVEPVGPHVFGYVAVMSAQGAPVWWDYASAWSPWDAKLLPDGNLAWARRFRDHFGVRNRDAYEEHALDGRLVRLIRAVGNPTDTHDLTPLPNGDYLVIVYRLRHHADLRHWGGPANASVFDGEVQEVTPDGRLVWSWSTRGHLSPGAITSDWWKQMLREPKSSRPDAAGYDLYHLNSVQPDGDGLILSFRHLDAVYRIDRATGRIDWKLGGRRTPKSLRVIGDTTPGPLFSGQHDARVWTDGTVTTYDNATFADRPPAAVRYRIDPKARTATRLERVTNPHVAFSESLGSARKLPGGDWVVCWGHSNAVTEQAPDGSYVVRMHFGDNHYSYRAFPVLSGQLSAGALRRGMDAMARRPSR